MRKDFPLENDIFCKGKFSNFKLYYANLVLTPSCHAIAYIPKTLIAVKSKETVYVYKPEIVTIGNNTMLKKIATFETFDCNAYLKVKIDGKVYIIDSNVQISLCECAKMY